MAVGSCSDFGVGWTMVFAGRVFEEGHHGGGEIFQVWSVANHQNASMKTVAGMETVRRTE